MLSCSRILFSSAKFSPRLLQPSSFSQRAWRSIEPLYQDIQNHPFNVQLARGTLAPEIFARYSEQDAHYLPVYYDIIRCIAAGLAYPRAREMVRQFAKDCLDERDPNAHTELILPSTAKYIAFLKHIMETESVPVMIAAVLPCFRFYKELACYMQRAFHHVHNPYSPWIKRYSREEFCDTVKFMCALADEHVCSQTEGQALGAYVKGAQAELGFYDGVYWHKELKQPRTSFPVRHRLV